MLDLCLKFSLGHPRDVQQILGAAFSAAWIGVSVLPMNPSRAERQRRVNVRLFIQIAIHSGLLTISVPLSTVVSWRT